MSEFPAVDYEDHPQVEDVEYIPFDDPTYLAKEEDEEENYFQ